MDHLRVPKPIGSEAELQDLAQKPHPAAPTNDLQESAHSLDSLTLPVSATDMAVILSALSDGLLAHWLNDARAVPTTCSTGFWLQPS